MTEEEDWTTDEIEGFIWKGLCKAYDRGVVGEDFKPLFDDEDVDTPSLRAFDDAVEFLELRNLVKRKGPSYEEFVIELTHAGKKVCEEREKSSEDFTTIIERYI